MRIRTIRKEKVLKLGKRQEKQHPGRKLIGTGDKSVAAPYDPEALSAPTGAPCRSVYGADR